MEQYLRFEKKTKLTLKSFRKQIKLSEFYKILSKTRKKPIPDSIISLFYNDPQKFFLQHKELLNNTSYFDSCGNSIFMHYFYILYEDYKINNNEVPIYKQNFDTFFKEHKNYLIVQDICLDTALHKISRLKNKTFFIYIFQKLQDLNIINAHFLSLLNVKKETIFHYIFEEININFKHLIITVKYQKEYDSFITFLKTLKDSYLEIYEEINNKSKQILNKFTKKYVYDIIKFNNIDYLVNKRQFARIYDKYTLF